MASKQWLRSLSRSILATTAALLLVPSAKAEVAQRYVSSDNTFSVAIDGDALVYRGELSTDGVEWAEKYLSRHPSLRVLAIESQGGDVDAGMRLGDLVLARSMDVRVIGAMCASSCANFVFVSGRRKSIEPGAILLWHGSSLRPEYIPVTSTVEDSAGGSTTAHYEGEALLEYLGRPAVAPGVEQSRQRHVEFFERRNVNGRITVFGQEIGCNCQWTFTLDDMEKFGINDIQPDPGYPWPASLGVVRASLLQFDRPAARIPGSED